MERGKCGGTDSEDISIVADKPVQTEPYEYYQRSACGVHLTANFPQRMGRAGPFENFDMQVTSATTQKLYGQVHPCK